MSKNKVFRILLWCSGAATAAICAVMNLFLLPSIEKTTEGIRCFDMNFGYDHATAARFLELLSPEGRNVYLTRQLPLDFLYPVAYCLFFSLLLVALTKKRTPLIALPVALAGFDYTENVCILLMLRSTELSPSLVSFASAVTMIKTVLLYAVILLILILIVVYFVKRKKTDNKSEE